MPIVKKYYNALKYFKKQDNKQDNSIYYLLKDIGEPKFIINAPSRSLTCLIIGSIVGQKISFARARKIRGKIYTQLGTNFNVNDIEQLDVDSWKSFGLEDFQIKTIHNLIAFHNSKDSLINIEDINQIDTLKEIKGIGNWTIDNIKIMYDVHNYQTVPDIILVDDYIICKSLDTLYGKHNIHTIKKLHQLLTDKDTGESYVGLVHWYLWRHAKGNIY